MKTTLNQFPVRNLNEKLALIVLMSILLLVSCFQESTAQSPKFTNDPHFPGKRKFSAGLITTYRGSSIAAPVFIGDVTYGVTNRFSLGLVAGTTGTLSLVAVKVAANLYQHENFRLLYRMSMIYYPQRNGTYLFDNTSQQIMPWMLTMGLIDGEWKFKNGVRWSVGMGLLETHCVDGMMKFITGRGEKDDDDLPLDVFNTVQTSVSIPLSKKLTLRPETILVFKGTQLVTVGDHKVHPVNIYLNLVYNF